jgi:predicted dehydrogenase
VTATPLPTDRPPVRIAVVGLGYWGPNLVRVLHDLPDADVAAVCDRAPEKLERIARRYPDVAATTSYDELLAFDGVDAVAIATPVSSHFRFALAALERGKHVLVEKPMTASLTEAQALLAVAEARRLTLMPAHTFLYSPPVNAVRDLIRSDELGEIYFISTSRVNLGLHQSDVSVVWDLGPHDFSILRYWLGETPSEVSAVTRSCIVPGIPDVAFINLRFPSGTVAHAELSWLAPSKLRRTAIVGSRKMVVYDDTSTEPVRVFDSGAHLPDPETYGQYKLTYRTGDIVSLKIDPTEPLALELADFCTAVRTGAEPRASAAVGLAVVQVIEAVDRSLGRGGIPTLVLDGAPAAPARVA